MRPPAAGPMLRNLRPFRAAGPRSGSSARAGEKRQMRERDNGTKRLRIRGPGDRNLLQGHVAGRGRLTGAHCRGTLGLRRGSPAETEGLGEFWSAAMIRRFLLFFLLSGAAGG